MQVKSNKAFQVPKGKFAISKPESSYDLKVSVDGGDFETKQSGINEAAYINGVPNCFYKIESSGDFSVNIQY